MKLTKLALTLGSLTLAAFAQNLPTANSNQPRLLCLYFDLGSLNSSDLAKAQDQAVRFLSEQATPEDRVTVMTYTSRVNVISDFTGDKDALAAAIRSIMADQAAPAPGAASRLQGIQAAARLLEVLPQKKAMIYFSAGVPRDIPADLRTTVQALTQANVSMWPVDARALVQ